LVVSRHTVGAASSGLSTLFSRRPPCPVRRAGRGDDQGWTLSPLRVALYERHGIAELWVAPTGCGTSCAQHGRSCGTLFLCSRSRLGLGSPSKAPSSLYPANTPSPPLEFRAELGVCVGYNILILSFDDGWVFKGLGGSSTSVLGPLTPLALTQYLHNWNMWK
jgi:hypothetical protein